MLYKGVVMAA